MQIPKLRPLPVRISEMSANVGFYSRDIVLCFTGNFCRSTSECFAESRSFLIVANRKGEKWV